MDYVNWFASRWPRRERRHTVLQQYRALALHHRELLADLALRNYVLAPVLDASNLYQAGIAEGRRQCVLEVLHLANMDIDQLWEVIERKTATTTTTPRQT